MDLPPSGWYPDPYGVADLLRWWDGAAWTEHTYAEAPPAVIGQAGTVQAGAGVGARTGTETTTVQPAVTSVQPAVQSTSRQPTTVQRATIQPTAVQATTVQPTTVQPSAVQSGTMQPAQVQLGTMGPPAGPRTEPQPAIPAGYAGASGEGTRVLFLGNDAWSAPGAPSRVAEGERYRAQRRRRMLLAAGLGGGVLAALAVIALVINSMGQSNSPAAAQTTPPATPASLASSPSAAASPSASASPTVSPAATVASTLTDSTSGLSYGQLSTPWANGCPTTLSGSVFTWTGGESAVAGQVNNGQTTWYGVACSGPLPQQYGYTSTADLENVATNLANTFNGTYYSALPHSMQTTESEPVSISGHPGWEVEFLMTYTNPQGMAWTNELGAVIVADPQTGAAPAVFYTSVPGNLNEANVATLVSSLQLAAVAPTASPSVTTGATPTTSSSPSLPAGPGQGGGQGGGNGGGQNP